MRSPATEKPRRREARGTGPATPGGEKPLPSPASPSEPLAQCGGAERASVASALDASAFLRGIAFDPQVVRVRRTAKGQDHARAVWGAVS